MDKRIYLVSLLAIFAVLTLNLVSAASFTDNLKVSINGADVDSSTVSGLTAGETVPVKLVFTANENQDDVKITSWISGYRDESVATTSRFDVINGSTYTKNLDVTLPSKIDPEEDFKLVVRFESSGKSLEQEYLVKAQRESYATELLSVDMPSSIEAGNVLNIDVVLKNVGRHELEDMFVVARIPSLGIEKKAYFSDLVPTDSTTDDDKEDATERVISLRIPDSAKSGTYNVEVEASNDEVSASADKKVSVTGMTDQSEVLIAGTSKNVAAGGEATYDLVIVNSGSKMEIYTISAESTKGLSVTVPESIVTVSADSSRVVKVNANVDSKTEAGTYTFIVDVNSGDQLVQKVTLSANVESKVFSASPVTMLTVVLVIIFVVLLIVLIVLLTREKTPEPTESYY